MFTKLPLPCYKLIYMPKQSQRTLHSLLYNFPWHREVGNLNQAQTSAMNSVCELGFAVRIFGLINENAPETVTSNLSLCFLIFCCVVLCGVKLELRIKIQRCLNVYSVGRPYGSQVVEHNRVDL